MITINKTHFKRYIQHIICEELTNKLIAHENHDANNRPSEFNETNADNSKSRYQIWTMADWSSIIESDDGQDSLPPVKLQITLYYGENNIPMP